MYIWGVIGVETVGSGQVAFEGHVRNFVAADGNGDNKRGAWLRTMHLTLTCRALPSNHSLQRNVMRADGGGGVGGAATASKMASNVSEVQHTLALPSAAGRTPSSTTSELLHAQLDHWHLHGCVRVT